MPEFVYIEKIRNIENKLTIIPEIGIPIENLFLIALINDQTLKTIPIIAITIEITFKIGIHDPAIATIDTIKEAIARLSFFFSVLEF